MNAVVTDPGFHAYAVMALVVLALILFASGRVPLATSSLLILVLLTLLFEVFPFYGDSGAVRASDLFLGFGHQALVAVCSLMIAGQALVRTGALEPIGRQLALFGYAMCYVTGATVRGLLARLVHRYCSCLSLAQVWGQPWQADWATVWISHSLCSRASSP